MIEIQVLHIPEKILSAIVERARSNAPLEVVGILAGLIDQQEAKVLKDYPLTNISQNPSLFLANPREQFLTERTISSLQQEIVTIYHSHPEGDSSFSKLDEHFAGNWHCLHLVIGLESETSFKAYLGSSSNGFSKVSIKIIH